MKILIDINHPAHVHYFRNFIKLMQDRGHTFIVINQDNPIINALLDRYEIPHIVRNKRSNNKNKYQAIWYLIKNICWCIRQSLKFHPDLYMGFASSACAVTSFIFRKPCVLLDDTEHNAANHSIYLKFCTAVLTPFYFKLKFKGNKQHTFNAYVEQLYLHSNYYHPSDDVLTELGVQSKEYVLIRYTAYTAHHDLYAKPISEELKKAIVTECAKHFKVFVSLEKDNNDVFYKPYKLNISPEKIHDVMYHARFMVAQGATMPSEAFVLGVPYLRLSSSLRCGNIDYQCEHFPNRAMQTQDENTAMEYIRKLCHQNIDHQAERLQLEKDWIDPTEYLISYVSKFDHKRQK